MTQIIFLIKYLIAYFFLLFPLFFLYWPVNIWSTFWWQFTIFTIQYILVPATKIIAFVEVEITICEKNGWDPVTGVP